MTDSAAAPRVGIVILNWNGYDVTHRCLESLRAATYQPRTVYLADNGSTDGSFERLRGDFEGDGHTFIANGANLGFAAGNNPGIRRALDDGCELVLLLNNDTVCVRPDFLDRGVERMRGHADAGIVGGKIVGWPETTRLWSVGGEVTWMSERFLGLGEVDRGQYDQAAERSFVSGALMLVRREVFDAIGPLPEVYFFGGEDRELGLRARRAGFRLIYEPGFVVAHEAGGSHGAARPEFVYNEALSKILFRRRNFGALAYGLWRATYRLYLEILFPLRRALRPGIYQHGLAPEELRGVLRDALRDSKRLDAVTLETIAAYRERRAAPPARPEGAASSAS